MAKETLEKRRKMLVSWDLHVISTMRLHGATSKRVNANTPGAQIDRSGDSLGRKHDTPADELLTSDFS